MKQTKFFLRLLPLLLAMGWLTTPLGAQTQLGMDIDGEALFDQSGISVSFSADGNRVAIGAYVNDGNGTDSGHVRVYEWDGSSWTQVGADIDGEAADDQSGRSVSLSADGKRVAIGATDNDGNGSNSGHVRVYEWTGSSWTQVGADIDGEAVDDQSGTSVSLSADGKRVAIGAELNDGNGNDSGHVRVYAWDGSSWTQVGADIDGEAAGDFSGRSVSLSADGNRVAIGATGNDDNGSSSGHVRVYAWDGSSWTQVGSDIAGEAAGNISGQSVSLSADGNRVAIGAMRNDDNGTNSGHVRVYAWDGSSWTQVGADIDGEAAGDFSGRSVSLSADGNRVAIGATGNDGNGNFSGQVRVYEWTGSSWTQVGADIDGEAAFDQSGWSVSLSADGKRVAIGATGNDGNGFGSGHVRVYELIFPCQVAIVGTTTTPVSCQGSSDGTLTITATGATNINFTIDGPGGMQTNTTGVFVDLMAGNFSVTVSDADVANCSVTKTSTVSTAADTEDPMAICPGNITASNDAGECGAEVTFDIDVSDNCPGATVKADPPSGSFFPVGTTTVTVTATDASGNTDQCTFDVTVNDTEVPMVDCTAEIMVDNDPGLCEATIDLPVPDTSDNCGIVSFEYRFVAVDEDNNEIGPFSDWFDVEAGATITLDVGRFRIRFRADDAAGNRGGCNQFVTVTDTEAPLITACAGTTVDFNGEDSFNSEDVIDFAATDNCEIVSTTFDPPLISCEDLGTTIVVTVTVTDAAGNSESCMTNVVVDGLPCGFMLAEIGCQGDADYDVPTETFTLEATNCLYGNPFNQDELTYVKTELCGNGEIIAEVDDVEAFAWAGIMMRETLDQGSKKVALSRDNGNLARREARTATNGPAYPQQFPAFGKNWLRLVRNGNQFIGYVSPNGVQWQQVMVANISMDQCIYVGLFLTNKQPNQTVSADFRNVEVNQGHSGTSLQQLPATNLATPADVSVYPNPTAGLLTVDLGAMLDQDVQLELRNTNGQLLRQLDLGRVSERRTELQLGDLPVGIYWLRVQAMGEAPITKRIVIQRP